jgi:hypothetical protein
MLKTIGVVFLLLAVSHADFLRADPKPDPDPQPPAPTNNKVFDFMRGFSAGLTLTDDFDNQCVVDFEDMSALFSMLLGNIAAVFTSLDHAFAAL